ncbi:hypothetical protein CRENBAI_011402 [Crenichthys baileyi]|uniref:Neurogenic mastermind-like N-terminal domain-containing protein n=1 Tax=Crenichthys baileyi TaxID=28760 RepID=A0AAV9SKK4_9TELE
MQVHLETPEPVRFRQQNFFSKDSSTERRQDRCCCRRCCSSAGRPGDSSLSRRLRGLQPFKPSRCSAASAAACRLKRPEDTRRGGEHREVEVAEGLGQPLGAVMGDFASPAVGPNGSICINNSMNPASGSVVSAGAVGIPKHSTVVERLRQRIEGCRRHHTICETRYQQAHSEQQELDRRETVNLYQRTLEQRAKKSTGGSKQPQNKPSSSSRTRTLCPPRSRGPARL